ncbi:MAG: hypothetical protein IPN94_13385 [Sphingobacteriales bacterium]|nr:hypothetical protein [Sphingobacteriales bacterium]
MKNQCCHIIYFTSIFLFLSFSTYAQTFTNNTATTCGSDFGTGPLSLQPKLINVSGLPNSGLSTSGITLNQVNLKLGTSVCTGNLSTYVIKLTNPSGFTIFLAGGGGTALTTTGTGMWVNMSFRDDPALERLNQYSNSTQSGYQPHTIGYYAIANDGDFSAFNDSTNPNGNWRLDIIENTSSEVSFERVDLVFGIPITPRDVTTCENNNNCGGAVCIGTGGVLRASNEGYTPNDPKYPGDDVGTCSWNGANNNSAWFSFQASGSTAYITISGMANSSGTGSSDMQPIVLYNPNGCANSGWVVPNGGCPDDQPTNNNSYSNTLPDPNTGGVSPSNIYFNGITDNCEFNLSGLTPGNTYFLYVDGNGGLSSDFYIEVESGAVTCPPQTLAEPLFTIASPFCSGTTPPILPTTSNNNITGTWSPSTVNNTTSGSYIFTPNPGQCADTASKTITVNPIPVVTANSNSPICVGSTLNLTATGGGTYNWAGPNGVSSTQQNPNIPNVTTANAGTYTVTVTAASPNTCTATAQTSVTINNPSASASPTPNTACAAPFNGGASLTTSGFAASPTPTYAWSNSATTQNLSNVAAGTYTVTVTQGSCSTTANVTITNNITLSASASPTPNTACATPFNGGATLTTSGFAASPTPTYVWSNSATTQNLSNVAAGTYTVTVTQGSCSTTANVTITNNITLSASASPTPNTACAAPFNGGASLTTSGFAASPTPTYVWSNNATTQNLSNVAAGTYTVTVTQGSCSTTANVTVVDNITLSASASPTPNTACAAPFNGGATLTTSGFAASPTPTYAWSNSTTTQNLSNVAAGTYTVTVTQGSCSTTANVTVTNNITLSASASPTPNTACAAPFNGGATLTTSGFAASPTPTYVWSNSATTQNLSNVAAGTYTVTVTQGSCSTTANVTVVDNIVLSASASPTPNTACATPFNGGASLTTSGFAASPTPTYVWNNGATTQNLSNVAAGTYTVTVTQGSCSTTANVTVVDNIVLSASASPTPNTACATPFNGGASLTTSGFAASPTPTYAWSNSTTTQNLSNVAAGTYTVTVTQGSCSTTANVTVVDNIALSASASPTPNTACATPFNGGASLTTSGFAASPTPTYAWSNSATTQNLSNVAAGTYTVTVTQGSCSTTANVTVVDNIALSASASPTPNTACAAPFNGGAKA